MAGKGGVCGRSLPRPKPSSGIGRDWWTGIFKLRVNVYGSSMSVRSHFSRLEVSLEKNLHET
jgi:hypothetical protein